MAVYRECRRGRLDDERWRHDGYRLREAGYARLRESFTKDSVFDDYGRRGTTGNWSFEANGLEVTGGWPIEIVKSEGAALPEIAPDAPRLQLKTDRTFRRARVRNVLQDGFYLAALLCAWCLSRGRPLGRGAILVPFMCAALAALLWQIVFGRRDVSEVPRWWAAGLAAFMIVGFVIGVMTALVHVP